MQEILNKNDIRAIDNCSGREKILCVRISEELASYLSDHLMNGGDVEVKIETFIEADIE